MGTLGQVVIGWHTTLPLNTGVSQHHSWSVFSCALTASPHFRLTPLSQAVGQTPLTLRFHSARATQCRCCGFCGRFIERQCFLEYYPITVRETGVLVNQPLA